MLSERGVALAVIALMVIAQVYMSLFMRSAGTKEADVLSFSRPSCPKQPSAVKSTPKPTTPRVVSPLNDRTLATLDTGVRISSSMVLNASETVVKAMHPPHKDETTTQNASWMTPTHANAGQNTSFPSIAPDQIQNGTLKPPMSNLPANKATQPPRVDETMSRNASQTTLTTENPAPSTSSSTVSPVQTPKATSELPLIHLPADKADQSHLPPNATAVVCSIQRHEGHYLDEFVDYHLGLGFAEIVVYDNSDHFELASLQGTRAGLTVLHLNSTKPMQRHAYSLCIRRSRNTHTWITMLDIDERLVLKKNDNVVDFAREYCPRHHLAINWRFFGFSGQERRLDLPLSLRQQCRAEDGYLRNSMVKPFAYLADVHRDAIVKSPHRLHRAEGALEIDTSGKIVASGDHPGRAFHARGATDVAVVFHYKYKSRQEFIDKCLRGSAISGHAFTDQKVQYALQNLDNRVSGLYRARCSLCVIVSQGDVPRASCRIAQPLAHKQGKPIPPDTIFDDSAWKILRRVSSKYASLESSPLFAEARKNWTCVNDTAHAATNFDVK